MSEIITQAFARQGDMQVNVFKNRLIDIAKKNDPKEFEERVDITIKSASIAAAILFTGFIALTCKVIAVTSLSLLSVGLIFAVSYCVCAKLVKMTEERKQTFSRTVAINIVEKLVRNREIEATKELAQDPNRKGSLPDNWKQIVREKALSKVFDTLKN